MQSFCEKKNLKKSENNKYRAYVFLFRSVEYSHFTRIFFFYNNTQTINSVANLHLLLIFLVANLQHHQEDQEVHQGQEKEAKEKVAKEKVEKEVNQVVY